MLFPPQHSVRLQNVVGGIASGESHDGHEARCTECRGGHHLSQIFEIGVEQWTFLGGTSVLRVRDLQQKRSPSSLWKLPHLILLVTMSRAPRLLFELHDTLPVMAEDMTHAKESYYATNASHPSLDTFNDGRNASLARTFPSNLITLQHRLRRNKAHETQIQKNVAQQLSVEIFNRIKARLRHKWKAVSTVAAFWRSHNDFKIDAQ